MALTRQTFFSDSAYPAAPASFRNYGSIALRDLLLIFSAFMLSVVLVGIELKNKKMTCKQQPYVKTFFFRR